MTNEDSGRMESIEKTLAEVLDRLRDLEQRMNSVGRAANPNHVFITSARHPNQRTLWSPHQERVLGEEVRKGDDDESR